MMTPDTDLIHRSKSGDSNAFSTLMERHREPVRRYARRLTRNDEDALDVIQETFVRAFQKLNSLDDGGKFCAWLYRIAFNAAMDRKRRSSQLTFDTLYDETEGLESLFSSLSDDGRLKEEVQDALSALSDEQREVVRLHYFQGYDYAEIGDRLGVPSSTVRGRLSLARRALKKEMIHMTRPVKEPILTASKDWQMFRLTPDDLSALRSAETMAARDTAWPSLKVVRIEPDGTILSNDMSRIFVSRGSSIRPRKRILLSSALFSRLPYLADPFPAQLALTDTEAALYYTEPGSNVERVERLPLTSEADYPLVESILPPSWRMTARLPAGDLLLALEDVARFESFVNAMARPDSAPTEARITLTFSKDRSAMTVSKRVEKDQPLLVQWEVSAEIPTHLDGLAAGEAFTLALDRALLRDCIYALALKPRSDLRMRANDPLQPVMLCPADSEDRFTVLMPMRADYRLP